MENKQTAVEWLEDIIAKMEAYGGDLPPLMVHIKKAKEMEKQKIIEFAEDYIFKCVTCSYNGDTVPLKSAEHYYKETFENK